MAAASRYDPSLVVSKECLANTVQGVVVHLALAQDDCTEVSPPHIDAQGSQPERSMLSNSVKNLAISAPARMYNGAGPKEDMALQGPGQHQHQPSPMTVHMQHPFTMWPVICQPQMQPSMAYVLDSNQQFHQGTSPSPMGHYQITPPRLSRHGQMAHVPENFSQPRTMPGIGHPDSRRQHAARVSRSSFYNVASHHNHVDVARIREGIDVRTTVSLHLSLMVPVFIIVQ